MGLKLSNNAISRLASNLTSSGTSISLVPGDGALFPILGAGDYFPATLSKADGTIEIIKVTARSSDTLTVTRAQEGTAAQAFNANDRIEVRLTAATVETINTLADNSVQKTGNQTVSGIKTFSSAPVLSAGAKFPDGKTQVRAGLQSLGQVALNANTTLNSDHSGSNILVLTAGITITFPSTLETFLIKNISGGSVSLVFPAGSDHPSTLEAGGSAMFCGDGGGYWRSYADVRRVTTDKMEDGAVTAAKMAAGAAAGNLGYTPRNFADGIAGKTNGISANGAIPASYIGGYIYIDGTATAVSLPQASTVPVGSVLFMQNTTPGATVTISAYSGDSIWNDGSVTSFVLPYLAYTTIIRTGTNTWNVISRQKAPSYAPSSVTGYSTAVWHQVPVDMFVTMRLVGSYRNNINVYIGTSVSSYTMVLGAGDDLNNNTKYAGLSFYIKAGSYFYVENAAEGWEEQYIYGWPLL